MPQDPVSSAVPYCTPAQLLPYCDWRLLADCLRDDDGPRPSRTAILDPGTEAGSRLLEACLAASGDLESSCLARSLYSPDDLASLTGAGKAHLRRVVAGLTLLLVFQRRQPSAAKVDDLPAVVAAREAMERLHRGERIFATVQNRDAGAGMVAVERAADPMRTVNRASRYFGLRQRGGERGGE